MPNIKLEQLQWTVLNRLRDFSKTNNIYKVIFHCYCRNVFSKLLWIVQGCFQVYDTHYRHFCWILNWINCRSLFWSNHMTWAILSFFKRTFSFLSSKCVFKGHLNGFYDLETTIRFVCIFWQISDWRNCWSLFWSGHVTLVNLIVFVE